MKIPHASGQLSSHSNEDPDQPKNKRWKTFNRWAMFLYMSPKQVQSHMEPLVLLELQKTFWMALAIENWLKTTAHTTLLILCGAAHKPGDVWELSFVPSCRALHGSLWKGRDDHFSLFGQKSERINRLLMIIQGFLGGRRYIPALWTPVWPESPSTDWVQILLLFLFRKWKSGASLVAPW